MLTAQHVLGLVALLGVTATACAHTRLVVTVTDQSIRAPETLESGYTEFVLDNQASGVYAHEIVRIKDGGDARAVQRALPGLFSEEADEANFAMIVANTDKLLGGAVGTVPGGERSVGLTLTPVIYADEITHAGISIDPAHTAVLTVTQAAEPAAELQVADRAEAIVKARNAGFGQERRDGSRISAEHPRDAETSAQKADAGRPGESLGALP